MRTKNENANEFFDSLFASSEAATKLDDRAALRKAFKTIGLPTDNLHKIMDLDAEGKEEIADGILKAMGIGMPTWEKYFEEAPYTLSGVEGKETLEAMKEIHRILINATEEKPADALAAEDEVAEDEVAEDEVAEDEVAEASTEAKIVIPPPIDRPLPAIYIEGEYEKDNRHPLEKLSAKVMAAREAPIGSARRFNFIRGVVGNAQKLGHDIEMPKTDEDAEALLKRFSFSE